MSPSNVPPAGGQAPGPCARLGAVTNPDASTETATETATASAASPVPTAPAPASLPRRRGAGLYRVIMVCTGNICRSAMAGIVLNDRLAAAGLHMVEPDVVVTSAGVSDE